jgi:HlyD family secretion protein
MVFSIYIGQFLLKIHFSFVMIIRSKNKKRCYHIFMKLKLPSIFKRRWFIFLVIIGIIFSIYFLTQKKGNGVEEKTFQIKRQDIAEVVSTSGSVSAAKRATLKFQALGRLAWVGVKTGDRVREWQAIASLDQRQLQRDLAKKLSLYMTSRMDFEQTHDDYEVKGRDLELVTLTDEEKRIVNKAQYTMDRTVIDVETSDLARQYATIYTPIDGIVIEATEEIAGVNTSATTQYQIVDPATLRFEAEIEELDVAKIQPGFAATIILDALPEEPIQTIVSEVEFTSTTTTSGNTAYKAYLYINPDSRFRLDMNGDADIVISQKSQVLVAPIDMVSEDDDGQYVIVKNDKGFAKIYIQTRVETDDYFEIIEGINEGDTIYQPTDDLVKKLSSKKK